MVLGIRLAITGKIQNRKGLADWSPPSILRTTQQNWLWVQVKNCCRCNTCAINKKTVQQKSRAKVDLGHGRNNAVIELCGWQNYVTKSWTQRNYYRHMYMLWNTFFFYWVCNITTKDDCELQFPVSVLGNTKMHFSFNRTYMLKTFSFLFLSYSPRYQRQSEDLPFESRSALGLCVTRSCCCIMFKIHPKSQHLL